MKFMTRWREAPELSERERTLELLGMTRLREVEKIRGRVRLAQSAHQELDDNVDTPWHYSLAMWRRFLPTERQLRDYVLDSPPGDVLGELEQAALFKIFDRIEIWTPEKSSSATDRMVIGVIAEDADTTRYFRIAHWGSPHTSPSEVRAHLERLDLDAKQAERAKRRAKWWKKHKVTVYIGSAAAGLMLTVAVLAMVPRPVTEPYTPSAPSIEVIEEESAPSVEDAPVIPDGDTDPTNVEDFLPPGSPVLSKALSIIVGLVVTVGVLVLLMAGVQVLFRIIRGPYY